MGTDDASLADQIRRHVAENYVAKAHRNGDRQFRVRVGDVHSEMALVSRMPAVVAALGADIFLSENGVSRVNIEGPVPGASTVFVFEFP